MKVSIKFCDDVCSRGQLPTSQYKEFQQGASYCSLNAGFYSISIYDSECCLCVTVPLDCTLKEAHDYFWLWLLLVTYYTYFIRSTCRLDNHVHIQYTWASSHIAKATYKLMLSFMFTSKRKVEHVLLIRNYVTWETPINTIYISAEKKSIRICWNLW